LILHLAVLVAQCIKLFGSLIEEAIDLFDVVATETILEVNGAEDV
jgi:hypothetical protein